MERRAAKKLKFVQSQAGKTQTHQQQKILAIDNNQNLAAMSQKSYRYQQQEMTAATTN